MGTPSCVSLWAIPLIPMPSLTRRWKTRRTTSASVGFTTSVWRSGSYVYPYAANPDGILPDFAFWRRPAMVRSRIFSFSYWATAPRRA